MAGCVMSLTVNTNVSALTAQVHLGRHAGRVGRSLERLATGLRINRAADGPSGLMISEGQRAQVAGLSKAVSNTDRALSLVRTAEAGLGAINELLVDLRALVIDSANSGAHDTQSLRTNQAIVTRTLDAIDRIATETRFGRQRLLDASSGRWGLTSAGTSGADIRFLRSSSNDVVANHKLPIVVTQNAERAFVTATAAQGAGTLAQDETLSINDVQITLEAGSSQAAVIERVNQFAGQTGAFAVDVGGTTELRSTLFGDGAQITVQSNVAAVAASTTGFGNVFRSDRGKDAEGTIGAGIPGASGSTAGATSGLGRLLTGRRGESGSGVTVELGLVNETDVATAPVTAGDGAFLAIADNSRVFQVGEQPHDNTRLALPTARTEALGIGLRPNVKLQSQTTVTSSSTVVGPSTLTTNGTPSMVITASPTDPGPSTTVTFGSVDSTVNSNTSTTQSANTVTIVTTTTTTTTQVDQVDRTTVDVTTSPNNTVVEMISNGDFESGSLSGWTVTNWGSGGWVVNTGSFDPYGNAGPIAPISGSYDALTHQNNPGFHALAQSFVVPAEITSAVLAWSDRIRNSAGTFVDSIQEWQVLVKDSGGNTIQEVFATNPGDAPWQTGPNSRSFDLTSLLQFREGQTLQISFEERDNLTTFNASLDDVSLLVTTGTGYDVTTTTQVDHLTTTTVTTDLMVSTEVQTRTEEPVGRNLRSIDVRNAQSAQRALRIVDRAIEEVASYRGELGAFQESVLKTSQRNVQSLMVNMLDAESKVRDTDYSKGNRSPVGVLMFWLVWTRN